MINRLLIAIAFGAIAMVPSARAVDVGDTIDSATIGFKDIWYLPRTLSEFEGDSATVIVFINNTCPVAQRYMPVVDAMANEFAEKGVQFVGVNVSPAESIKEVAQYAIDYELDFPVVKDFGGNVAKAVGATHTPECVVLDAEGTIRYRGKIDDQYRLGGVAPEAKNHHLKDAITAVLAGGTVATTTTPVDGCDITFASALDGDDSLTFAEHVAPIVYAKCTECHREGTEAPFALISHRDVASRADMIAEVVSEGRMPPWFALPDHGDFANDRSLTSDERETLIRWAKSGKARGDADKMPAVPEFPDPEWIIGEPDLIITASAPFEVPETGYVDYQYVVLPYQFPHHTWVQGIEIKPSNNAIVHHANLIYLEGGSNYNEKRSFLTGRVPGGSPAIMDPGHAMLLPKDSALMLQIHYVTTGKPESDQISVGLRYADGKIDKNVRRRRVEDNKFAIEPGAVMHRSYAEEVIDEEADMLALFSHMHLRGRDMTFVAEYPDGKEETLLVIPNYSFDWQLAYRYGKGQKTLPKGTKVKVTAHFDNSEFNPFNPDAEDTVKYGPQTYHEMMIGYVYYTVADEHLNLMIDGETGKAIGPAESDD